MTLLRGEDSAAKPWALGGGRVCDENLFSRGRCPLGLDYRRIPVEHFLIGGIDVDFSFAQHVTYDFLVDENRHPSIFGCVAPQAQSSDDLPDAELDVLAFLWQRGSGTAADIRAGLKSFRPMAHGSVVTLLKRLEDKGLVAANGKQGKAFVYEPTRKPEPTYRKLVAELRDRVFGGNVVSLVSSLFAGRSPRPDELRELRKLLDDLSKEK